MRRHTIQKLKAPELVSELSRLSNARQASNLSRFFKTGKGEYGEGDIFLGVMVPQTRFVIKRYLTISLNEVRKLLHSKYHEVRLAGALILVDQFKKTNIEISKKKIFQFYLANSRQINNWDLVDLSCTHIVGAYLQNKNKSILYRLARSRNLWNRRIAIISTAYYIRQSNFLDALKISQILLKDKHDLIHKAVGWMMREVGKHGGLKELQDFLVTNIKIVPRTTLRYAIEQFPEKERNRYLNMR